MPDYCRPRGAACGVRKRDAGPSFAGGGWPSAYARFTLLRESNVGRAMDEPTDRSASSRSAPAQGAGAPFVERRVNKVDRRRITLRSLLQGGLTPRRRGGRRAGDHEQPIDWHDPYLMLLALVMLVLSIADAFMTVTLLGSGAKEANPLTPWSERAAKSATAAS